MTYVADDICFPNVLVNNSVPVNANNAIIEMYSKETERYISKEFPTLQGKGFLDLKQSFL